MRGCKIKSTQVEVSKDGKTELYGVGTIYYSSSLGVKSDSMGPGWSILAMEQNLLQPKVFDANGADSPQTTLVGRPDAPATYLFRAQDQSYPSSKPAGEFGSFSGSPAYQPAGFQFVLSSEDIDNPAYAGDISTQIYYTTDVKAPSKSNPGNTYTGAISIHKDTTLIADAWRDDGAEGPASTFRYKLEAKGDGPNPGPNSKPPQPGDTALPALWITLVVGSAGAFRGLLVYRRRVKRQKNQ